MILINLVYMMTLLVLLALGLLMVGTTFITTQKTTGQFYQPAFHGQPPKNVSVTIDPSVFDTLDYIDANGYLIPGTPLQADLTAADGPGDTAKYIIPYATKIAMSNSTTDLTAATNNTIAGATGGDVDRKAVENNLGRVLTADEVAAIEATGRFILV